MRLVAFGDGEGILSDGCESAYRAGEDIMIERPLLGTDMPEVRLIHARDKSRWRNM